MTILPTSFPLNTDLNASRDAFQLNSSRNDGMDVVLLYDLHELVVHVSVHAKNSTN